MKTIQLGSTDLQVSQVAYGCMGLGGSWEAGSPTLAERQEAVRLVRTAIDAGINFFDHADIYKRGKAEEAFAAVWDEAPGLREQIYLQSKCGIRFADEEAGVPGRYDFSYAHIMRSAEGSLRRLQTDYLDVLLLHRPDPLVEPEEVARAFDELESSGKVRYFGVSNHTAAQIELLQAHLDQPLVTNQVELNPVHTHLIDAGVVFNQDRPERPMRNEGTLEYCRLQDITLQAWSPLATGYLTGRQPEQPDLRLARASAVVAELSQELGVPGEAILIAWLLRHPAGIQPVVGTTNVERLQASAQGAEVELSREQWYRLFVAGRGENLP